MSEKIAILDVQKVTVFKSVNGGIFDTLMKAAEANARSELSRMLKSSQLYFGNDGVTEADVADYIFRNRDVLAEMFRQLDNIPAAQDLTNAEHVERCVDGILKK